MCIFCAWALWKWSLLASFRKWLFWQIWSFAKAPYFFSGLVWCQRTAEGLSTEPLSAFTFIAAILQSRVSLLVEFITFSRASQACCKWRWHQNSGSGSTGTCTVCVPFRSRNSWNSFLLKDKLKQTTSPLEGWGLKRKLLTVDNTIAFVVQHTLKSVIQDSFLLRPVDSPSLGD